ncbi:hypothetical protein GF327_03135 [Candidatus Woesearchaeota archaeon]|nr:hypothetical protein [Candidatus Woesearchaeota archaeon]
MKNKKGVSVYVSWIIVIAIVVSLSFIMYQWTLDRVKSKNQELNTRSDLALCEQVAVNIDGICQNPQILNINITNTKNIKIDRLVFRLVDIYGNSQNREEEVNIYPGEKEINSAVLKQGTLSSARIIPVIIQDQTYILCQSASIEKQNIDQC